MMSGKNDIFSTFEINCFEINYFVYLVCLR